MRSDPVTHDIIYEVNKDTCFNTALILAMRVIFNATGSVTFSDIITNTKRIM